MIASSPGFCVIRIARTAQEENVLTARRFSASLWGTGVPLSDGRRQEGQRGQPRPTRQAELGQDRLCAQCQAGAPRHLEMRSKTLTPLSLALAET